VRPWQHVLDCLAGYLTVAGALLAGEGVGPWNFGPDPSELTPVREIADLAAARWGPPAVWVDASVADHQHEEAVLTLDPAKAHDELGWRNLLAYPETVMWTLDWHRAVAAGESPDRVTRDQLERFASLNPAAPWLSQF